MLRNRLGKKFSSNQSDVIFWCTIRFLDDSEPLSVTYQKDTKGQFLFDHVCQQLDLVETDCFGLRYVDSEKQRHWLDLTKSVRRQLKHVVPPILCFRVKFYPTDPLKLKEEITRYFIFLQLRRDLHHGRLLCHQADANLLAAFIIQSELGDYDPKEHLSDYISHFKMLPKQTKRQEEKIAELHRTLVGQTQSEAEANFLTKAAQLDTYGVDPHPVRDQSGNQMYLGITHHGIISFQGSKKTRVFKWSQITKITFEGKMFIVHVTAAEMFDVQKPVLNSFVGFLMSMTVIFSEALDFLVARAVVWDEHYTLQCQANCSRFLGICRFWMKQKKDACGFKCYTTAACKHLWKCTIEQRYFYTLLSSSEIPKVTSGGGLFSRGSRFHFSGRCEKEAILNNESISRDEPQFIRSSSNLHFVRTYASLRSGSVPNAFSALGLSDESFDSFNHCEGLSKSLDDFSMFSVPEYIDHNWPDFPPDQNALHLTTFGLIGSPSRDVTETSDTHYQPPYLSDAPDSNSSCYKAAEAFNPTDTGATSGKILCLSNNVNSSHDPTSEEMVLIESRNGLSIQRLLQWIEESPGLSAVITIISSQRVSICCWSLILSVCMVSAILFLFTIFLLETEADVPVIRELRHLPEVQGFKRRRYEILKNKLSNLFG